MSIVHHINPDTLHSNSAFTQVVRVTAPATTIYVGGQNAVTTDGTIAGQGDIVAQTEQALANLEAALASAGAGLEHIVKWNVLVVQGQPIEAAFQAFLRVWGDRPNPPAITMAFVAGLANPAFLVEIDAVAVLAD